MDKKTSFVLYPADFLAAVHNFKKSQIADLIIALCEKNFYGDVSFKLSDPVKKRFSLIQETIEKNNAKYLEIREKRQASAKQKTANVKQNQSKVPTKSKQMCQHPHQMNRRMNRYMYVNL